MPPLISKQDSVYRAIRDGIADGEYSPGFTVPTELQLTERYQVSRTIVRISLRRLVGEGLITRRKGAGSFVTPKAREIIAADKPDSILEVAFVLAPKQVENPIYMGILHEFEALRLPGINLNLVLDKYPRLERYEEAGYGLCIFDGGLTDTFRLFPSGWSGKIIVLNRISERFNYICTDNVSGGRLLAEHLLGLGHTKLGLIYYGKDPDQDFVHRLKGVQDVLEEKCINPALEISINLHEFWTFNPHAAAEQMLQAVRDGTVTGIICLADLLVLAVYEVAEQFELKPGRDFSIIGYDDQTYSRFLNPPLTTVRQPIVEIAAKLGGGAQNFVSGARVFCANRMKPILIERSSTARIV